MTAIRRPKIYEEVAQRLEQRICDDTVVPGERLPSERDLMREFDVGRPAVREALFHLQKMGLVELRAGERARVTRPTPKLVVESLSGAARYMLSEPHGVRHFQEARAFFETGLARHAANHATSQDLRELKSALDANRQAIGDLRRFEETDIAFHYNLAIIPRNPIYTAIHAAIVRWLVEQRQITLATTGQSEIAYQAHAEIYRAIAERDPNRAERVIRAHLDQVSDAYWRATEGSQ